MEHRRTPVHGAGLGLRRALLGPLSQDTPGAINFLEVAPENWIRVGGASGRRFRALSERYPLVCHGLSLSLGGPAPLDEKFLRELKQFLDAHGARGYSEHLSYCSDEGQLYDLLPIPFTEEAVRHVATRIRRTQEVLGRRIAVENLSYYAAPGKEMKEIDFLRAVLEEADCDLLLDVNNIFVNSVNHRYDPTDYLLALPGERIAYCHIAGHFVEAEDLRIDTHGSAVIDPVCAVLDRAYQRFGAMPTLLERDFNIPPLPELLAELHTIRVMQGMWSPSDERRTAIA